MGLLNALIITCYVATGNPTASGQMPHKNSMACHRSKMYQWHTFKIGNQVITRYCNDTGHLGLNHFDLFWTDSLQSCKQFGRKSGELVSVSDTLHSIGERDESKSQS